ncbi:DNA mismatch repair protein MutS [Caldalkalibacillus salinus]|uniref:DNA mismatch repair protein MutS n=1 Tax=Caldalkalibacillus salinus TaxID=2803787 RepID=UPI001924CF47|nr:DNA mismatch repair protein MutS [Caldalkalibacillus salinus]
MAKHTPMIEQYLEIKEQYPDAFLFFRLGDFYELFFEDATTAAKELEITLTGRAGGGDERIPMCGVPYHSSMQYIKKLIDKGYKVAICEQVEDPKAAKGVVKREVIRVITPGTLMEEHMLSDRENNYILFLSEQKQDEDSDDQYALVATDLSTGEVLATQVNSLQAVLDEVVPYQSAEIVVSATFNPNEVEQIKQVTRTNVYQVDEQTMSTQVEMPSSMRLNKSGQPFSGPIKGALILMLVYLKETQKRTVDHLQPVRTYTSTQYLMMDVHSRRNLELTETIRDHSKKGTLLWLLDETSTAMGSRLLKNWVLRPLMDTKKINQRLDAVDVLLQEAWERDEIIGMLEDVYDLERLAGRVSYGNVNPRDLLQLRKSLAKIPDILNELHKLPPSYIQELADRIDPCQDLLKLLMDAIHEDAPLSVKEGGIFNNGYHQELDRLLEASRNGKQWIADLEQTERQRTGIKSLKVGYNKVFGYYIEVTKANLHLLTDDRYERKQTLANAERYITPELKEKEALILEANDRLMDLEYELFLALRETINQYLPRLQQLAQMIAQLDVLCAFAKVSETYGYTRPSFEKGTLNIKEGRHPVIEKVMGESRFVANDINMDRHHRQTLLITGPNMAGKSTYMRQTALIAVMGQIGCFVPAEVAVLPVFDQIFTRIGAADDLVGGQSTFMVEMIETKRAITQATENSLILLDEIGRGTSTYDGMSLAQAVVEYIHDRVKAYTLFSTHYHELTELEQKLRGVVNVHVACSEQDGKVVFLHKVLEGKADRSYGIHVAQLAQMPDDVIERAHQILAHLETDDVEGPSFNHQQEEQLSLFESQPMMVQEAQPSQETLRQETASSQVAVTKEPHVSLTEGQQAVISQIEGLNLVKMTPLEALNMLYEMQEGLKKNETGDE